MAFRQSTFRQSGYHGPRPQRIYTAPEETQAAALAPQSQQIADSQEWVLFSPSATSTTDRTYATSSDPTCTAGHSQISHVGSVGTGARSYGYGFDDGGGHTEDGEEDGELDSLDSHLQEFRTEPSVYRSEETRDNQQAGGTVLPTHDGLGSFRVHQTLMGDEVQEQLYAFERYNPRRVKRRRDSVELGVAELESERVVEAERTRRIEKWRMEQSQLLVDEIQKETRRRGRSLSTEKMSRMDDREQDDMATLSDVGPSGHGEGELADDDNGSFWRRVTKRVIQDLIGIDDDLLSIIFGEALPDDDELLSSPPANRSAASANVLAHTNQLEQSSWEYRLLERIARELGILVNHLTEHPDAFSTYLRSQQGPLPYAGLPVIPESSRDQALPSVSQTNTSAVPNTPVDPHFIPTLQTAQPRPIPNGNTSFHSPLADADATPRASHLPSQPQLSREEWERDLDVKMVFRYLRSRFISRFGSPDSASIEPGLDFSTAGTSHLATASTADTAARAARVRQHHPLVSRFENRRRSVERRTWKASVPGGASAVARSHAKRGSSTCASERLSLSAKRNSGSSSRHYWDWGAGQSVGSGSLIASTGVMGSWGEV
ncbi:Uncharacterized protein BP5553_05169 [Venustampulla echinocandica]|uniref:Uncharacterized protein n=1 Tax=Venustampulla echinocandica TaxID=2656787 RepID=A0A370TQD7_9HELO|nr:Uncharacterized protein BP5553_05169 [Venustampulla echinocandica]RDL37736.1 Uncharacterized protein BP5553_05169 [Venustampulla echinocandica]